MTDEIKKYLFDIKQAIEEIESFIKNKTYRDFTKGALIQSAVENRGRRQLVNCWEIANFLKMPSSFRECKRIG